MSASGPQPTHIIWLNGEASELEQFADMKIITRVRQADPAQSQNADARDHRQRQKGHHWISVRGGNSLHSGACPGIYRQNPDDAHSSRANQNDPKNPNLGASL
jgi:hypothetical protein